MECIPKLKSSGGGGWETDWMYAIRNNWLVKMEYDESDDKVYVFIVHHTKTHTRLVDYVENIDGIPIFQCPICKRKSISYNFEELYLIYINHQIEVLLDKGYKIVIQPDNVVPTFDEIDEDRS